MFVISPLCMRLSIGALGKSKLQVVFNSVFSPITLFAKLFTAKVFLHTVGVNSLCGVVIYASEEMHDYQDVGSCAEIYFVHTVHFENSLWCFIV